MASRRRKGAERCQGSPGTGKVVMFIQIKRPVSPPAVTQGSRTCSMKSGDSILLMNKRMTGRRSEWILEESVARM